ncbi:MAG: hypothetical protein RLZZ316_2603, partial [Bacteroidota bacterium]
MLPTKFLPVVIAVALLYSFTNFQPPKNKVSVWLTKADSSVLLQQQKTNLHFTNSANASLTVIAVDAAQKYQTIDGFGFTLTGGSAALINRLNTNNKKQLLQELFGNKANAI